MKKYSLEMLLLLTASIATMVAIGCRKKKNTTTTQVVTCKHSPLVLQDSTCNLPISRKWHREYHEVLVMYSDTMYGLTDTLLPLTIINNKVFTIYGDTFSYLGGASSVGNLKYATANTIGDFSYKYLTDTMTFTHWIQINSATRKYYKVYYP